MRRRTEIAQPLTLKSASAAGEIATERGPASARFYYSTATAVSTIVTYLPAPAIA